MKTILLVMALALICYLPLQTPAQNATRARTETGKEVLLYADGTWKYAPEAASPKTNSNHNKGSGATSSYKPERGDFLIWYNPAKWRPEKSHTRDDIGRFTLIGTDGYAMILSEGLPIPTESLKRIALDNAKDAAPDARIASEEKRVVNGKEIVCLVIEGTIEKIPFTYYGYYYGGKQGTIQILTYTGQSLFPKYKDDFTEFLNGLEIKD